MDPETDLDLRAGLGIASRRDDHLVPHALEIQVDACIAATLLRRTDSMPIGSSGCSMCNSSHTRSVSTPGHTRSNMNTEPHDHALGYTGYG